MTQREVRRPHHGASVGMLACACGWNVVLGPFESTAKADGAVGAAWAAHLDPDPDPAGAPSVQLSALGFG